jgi:hypothetical protein
MVVAPVHRVRAREGLGSGSGLKLGLDLGLADCRLYYASMVVAPLRMVRLRVRATERVGVTVRIKVRLRGRVSCRLIVP